MNNKNITASSRNNKDDDLNNGLTEGKKLFLGIVTGTEIGQSIEVMGQDLSNVIRSIDDGAVDHVEIESDLE